MAETKKCRRPAARSKRWHAKERYSLHSEKTLAGGTSMPAAAAIKDFVAQERLELVRFGKRERKNDVIQRQLRRFKKAGKTERVVFVGVAQEKARVRRTTR